MRSEVLWKGGGGGLPLLPSDSVGSRGPELSSVCLRPTTRGQPPTTYWDPQLWGASASDGPPARHWVRNSVTSKRLGMTSKRLNTFFLKEPKSLKQCKTISYPFLTVIVVGSCLKVLVLIWCGFWQLSEVVIWTWEICSFISSQVKT